MDWDIEAEVASSSGGALTYDRVRRVLRYDEEGYPPAEAGVGEADLRNWMQLLLLSSFMPTVEMRAPRMAVQLILELARVHAERGDDPLAPLRARLARVAGRRPPLAG